MKYPKRSQYKHAKSHYPVRNWPEYEAFLRRRGDVTVWLSDEPLDAWRAPATGKPGGRRTYANIAIEAALTIGMVGLVIRCGLTRNFSEVLQGQGVEGRGGGTHRGPQLPVSLSIG